MVRQIYYKVLEVLKKKPFKLLGISLLAQLLIILAASLFCGIPAASLVIGWLIETALALIFLKGYEGGEVDCDMLFDCCRDWNTVKRVLGGCGWSALWILIWGLIPIVGPVFSVIRAYEYRLVPYILMREPEVSIKESRLVSRDRTEGFKGKMFLADILWVIAVIIAAIILLLLAQIPIIGVLFGFACFVLVVALILFSGLIYGLIKASFYVEIEKTIPGSPYYEEPFYKENPKDAVVCPQCGANLKSGDRFCSVCGARINPEENTATKENNS